MDWMHYRPVILATDALEAGACMYGVHEAMLSVRGCPMSMNIENYRYRNTTKFSMAYPRIAAHCHGDNLADPFGGNDNGNGPHNGRSFMIGDKYSGDGEGDDAFGDTYGEGDDGYAVGLFGNGFTDGDGHGYGHYGDAWNERQRRQRIHL